MAQVRGFVLHPSYQRCEKIIEAFARREELELLPVADLRRAGDRIRESEPDVIIAEVDSPEDPTLKTIEVIKKRIGKLPVVVVSREPTQDLLLRCMRAGSDEFLQFPIQAEEMDKALDRLERKLGVITEQEGTIVGIYSPTGGVGRTTMACNLAVNTGKLLKTPQSCGLIDMNLQFGTVALFLDIRKFSHNVADAMEDIGRLDTPLLLEYMTNHESGAAVLPAPLDIEEAESLNHGDMPELLELCKKAFKVTYLDLSTVVDDMLVVNLDACDQIMMVCDMMLPTVRNAIRARELFKKLDYKKDKIKLVVNRFYDSDHISLQEIVENVKLPIHWVVPYDSETAMKAANAGKTFSDIDDSTDVSRSLIDLARVTAGLEVESKKKRKKFSLLSWRS